MIRALRPEDLDQVMQIWLDANLEAHCFLPESYWCDHMEEVRAALPAAQVFVYQDWEGLQGFAGLTRSCTAGMRLEPPTISTLLIWAMETPESLMA